MIIQKKAVSAIFREQGLQVTPDAYAAIDREVANLIFTYAIKMAVQGIKRIKAEDVSLTIATNPTANDGFNFPASTDAPESAAPVKADCERCADLSPTALYVATTVANHIRSTVADQVRAELLTHNLL